MKIITLNMPWANWVSLGWKPIETRTHERFKGLVGQRIGIHASLKWDAKAMELAAPYLTATQLAQSDEFLRLGGAIICTAFVEDFRKLNEADAPDALIECKTTRYGLFLRDVARVEAIPCRGFQGIWNYEFPHPGKAKGTTPYLYPLFEHMSKEHGLTLTDSELNEILLICQSLNPAGEGGKG